MFRCCLAIAAAIVVAGCGGPSGLSAPEIRYGQAMCDVCGMIISDDRFAAAVVWIDGSGRHEQLLDDAGELAEASGLVEAGRRIYVHDAETSEWADGESAVFLRSSDLHTPMGTGILAFSGRDGAEAAQREHGGEVLTLAEVLRRDP